MSPLTKGSRRLIAAPRSKPQSVGGEYSIMGELEEDGGDGDTSSFAEYCSLSDGIVIDDSERGFVSDDIAIQCERFCCWKLLVRRSDSMLANWYMLSYDAPLLAKDEDDVEALEIFGQSQDLC
jgi:hypothetical protein